MDSPPGGRYNERRNGVPAELIEHSRSARVISPANQGWLERSPEERLPPCLQLPRVVGLPAISLDKIGSRGVTLPWKSLFRRGPGIDERGPRASG